MRIMYGLTFQEDIDYNKGIDIIFAPPGLLDVIYDSRFSEW